MTYLEMALVHENTFLLFKVRSKICLAYFWKFLSLLSLLLCTSRLEFVFIFCLLCALCVMSAWLSLLSNYASNMHDCHVVREMTTLKAYFHTVMSF